VCLLDRIIEVKTAQTSNQDYSVCVTKVITVFYNAAVKTWDVIIIGGGIIGLSLSLELRKKGATVLVVERGQPGREASHAAGGMLVDSLIETPAALQELATASAKMYPEFAHELELESGMKVDLRDNGTILFLSLEHIRHPQLRATALSFVELAQQEPAFGRLPPDQEREVRAKLTDRGFDVSHLADAATAMFGSPF
jgi:glycine oxidase